MCINFLCLYTGLNSVNYNDQLCLFDKISTKYFKRFPTCTAGSALSVLKSYTFSNLYTVKWPCLNDVHVQTFMG
jgi:hypothetical protein